MSLRCDNCGALLHTDASGVKRCTFCDAETNAVERSTPTTETDRVARTRARERTEEPAKKKEKKSGDLAFPVYVASAVVLVGGFLLWDYLHAVRRWTSTPIVADVTGDGVEDVIGEWDERVRDEESHVVAMIDGKSRKIAWSTSLGKNVGGLRPSFPVALGGGVLVVGGRKPEVDLLDARTGKLLAAIDLPDRAFQTFVHDGSAWIDAGNDKSVEIDLATARATTKPGSPVDAARPTWAPFDAYQSCPHAVCRSADESPPIPDMDVLEVRVEGDVDDAIAVGRKANGTHLPMLAGFSVSRRSVAWTHVFATPDTCDESTPVNVTLARGRVYFGWSDKKQAHLGAASVTTGEILWDVTRKSVDHPQKIVVAENVYVVRDEQLEVLDAKTGATLAVLP